MDAVDIIFGLLGTLILSVIASLVASFIYPSLLDRLVALVARLNGSIPFRRPARFDGYWKSTWEVDSPSYQSPVVDDMVEIRQLGRRIYAKSRAGCSDFYLVGLVDAGRYITGKWFDKKHGGYHGAFQFIVDPATSNFKGMWIGFSRTGVVKNGEWTWERQDIAALRQPQSVGRNQCI